jgi:anti-sigma B factor antagonist
VQKVAHPPEFVCDVRADAGSVVVRLAGELDLEVAGGVAAAVEELLDDGCPHVVVDLRELSFVDSSGIHMLVAASRSAERRHRAVSLIPGPQHVQRVLELTATDSLFSFVAADGGRE